MMGRQTAPAKLFYDFDIESHVPADHLLRQVDRFLDLGDIRAQLGRSTAISGGPRSTLS